MKAAVLHASQDIRYEECPTPEIRPGCVKINVRACGICGSDIPRVLGDAAHFFPIVLGHEFSGEVVEIADDVKNVAVGDHVVCAPLLAREQVVQAAEFRLEPAYPLCVCRRLSADHGGILP